MHNRSERSFTGRKGQEACVLKFQGSKNKMGAWIPMAVDGERWRRARRPELFLGCRRLTAAPDNQHKWLHNHPPQTLSVIPQPQVSVGAPQTVTRAPLVFFIYMNFASKVAFESLSGFGLLSVNFRTMKGKQQTFILGLKTKKSAMLVCWFCHSHSLLSHFSTSW